jgi:hypothetical protein
VLTRFDGTQRTAILNCDLNRLDGAMPIYA